MSKVHSRGVDKRTCLQTIRRNRVDFEAVQSCRAVRGKPSRSMFNPIEFNGIKTALLIAEELPQSQRLERLNRIAIQQMTLLAGDGRMKLTGGGE